ncbi:MAG: FG-GAP-like repeat-containing protein, partial [Acidobacteriota bacterium]|nr:FG-GAP-like repeat-containing protein [Acidobacteriota bacterium]
FVPAYVIPAIQSFNRVKVLSSGKILVSYVLPSTVPTLPGNPGNAVARFVSFNTDGSVDNTFNSPSNLTFISRWEVDSLDRILLYGGFDVNGTFVERFARLNSDGSVNTFLNVNFELGGRVSTLAIQPDGKVIIAGDFDRVSGVPLLGIARLNADGSLDESFNPGKGFNSRIEKIVVQPDGKIILAGNFSIYNSTVRTALVRLNADGTSDDGFNGLISVNGTGYTVALQPDGKILIGGVFGSVNGQPRTHIARLNPDGSLDMGFNPVLANPTPFQNIPVRRVLVQPNGKIMVGGSFSAVSGFARQNLVRLNADGTVDASFDAGLISAISFVELLLDGKYLVLASRLVRLNSNGTADATFQTATFSGNLGGFTISPVNAILVEPDGSIIIGGSFTTVNDIPRSGLIRLRANGTLDLTFFPSSANGSIRAIERQADGKIIVGGDFTRIANVTRLGVARLIVSSVRAASTPFDFDGDGKADISVFRPSNGFWYIMNSSGGFSFIQWGQRNDSLVPGDYDGDGKTDMAVYRSGAGVGFAAVDYTWYIRRSSDNAFLSRQWGRNVGLEFDTPVPADYDGDGKTDLAVYRLSDALGAPSGFNILQSSTNSGVYRQWGTNVDKRVPADYDGDGKADIAVYRTEPRFSSNGIGIWQISQSSDGATRQVQFGLSTDRALPADYDGDGKADLAVYRPSNGFWYILQSRDGFRAMQFGVATDKPTPADYDGDGKTDIAVFRPENGTWYLHRSTEGFAAYVFGFSDDIPIPNVYVR